MDSRTLNELVEYAYTLHLSLTADNVASILIAAQFLQMDRVAGLCWEYVQQHLNTSNCLAVHALASTHHHPRVAAAALRLLHMHFPQWAQSPEFLQVDAQQLTALIASEDVEVFSEDQVLGAVLRWLDHDRPGRLVHVASVLQNIHAPFLSDHCRQEYAAALASASPCQSTVAAKELHAGEVAITTPRHSYGAQEVIVCVGGGEPLMYDACVEAFSPSIPAVWHLAELPIPADCYKIALLDASTIAVSHFAGMYTVQRDSRYTGLRGEWREMPPMQTPRRDFGLAALNGRIYAVGGIEVDKLGTLASVEAYDPTQETWSAVAPLPVELSGVRTVGCDGRLFVFGGDGREEDVGRWAFCYDPAGDTWTRLRDMLIPRDFCKAIVAPSGLIYVIGGAEVGVPSKRVDAYDRVSDQWVRKADLIVERDSPGCACLDGKLYVLGGDVDSIEVYDEETDRWSLLECRLLDPQTDFDCVVMKLKRE
ncbi:kelch-like protein 3 [Paramacrobiotus metropolitanus]|uniref:kelch-like protein 3 n=1 Tax=Paramacrobiotus metropolitanus TaxID=2943436 RepID=UPI0024461707|nr:kelch-like protein 3 [Paramacrobiotus metropolitanus]